MQNSDRYHISSHYVAVRLSNISVCSFRCTVSVENCHSTAATCQMMVVATLLRVTILLVSDPKPEVTCSNAQFYFKVIVLNLKCWQGAKTSVCFIADMDS
jgi:hypothetical protein